MQKKRKSPFALIQEEMKGADVPRTGDPAEAVGWGMAVGHMPMTTFPSPVNVWILQTVAERGWYPQRLGCHSTRYLRPMRASKYRGHRVLFVLMFYIVSLETFAC